MNKNLKKNEDFCNGCCYRVTCNHDLEKCCYLVKGDCSIKNYYNE